ncbi:MAG TPA: helix-turn-helix transcriptional regulator [Actinomycetota bacterium]
MAESAPVIDTAAPIEAVGPGRARSREAERRRELAGFLRTRRERLAPEDVGLAPGYRRRTPGLRREEVAQLSAVGVTWYTWLEQGRPINVSGQVLESVARALRLDPSERSHLFTLAGVPDLAASGPVEICEPAVRQLVEALDPYPASVVGPRYDILAWNRAEAALKGDYSTLPEGRRNVMWLVFTQPAWRDLLVDQEDLAYLVARFRGAMAEHLGEPAWAELVEELCSTSTRFAELWERHDVAGGTSRVKRFLHPEVGLVRLVATSMQLTERPGARLLACTPADEEARTALTRLAELGPWRIDWALPDGEPGIS